MFFHQILEGQPDPVFGLAAAFQADPRPEKINLLVGIYKDEDLRSELMPSVRRAKERAADSEIDYLPIDGLREFCELLGEVVFGKEELGRASQRIYGAQTVGGTGALYVGGVFLAQEVTKNIAIPNPTWPNHRSIFERAGCNVFTYSYYNKEKHGFDFEAMKTSLLSLPEKTAILLQAVCHNPTGCDPSIEEWKRLSQIMLDRRLVPFFDCAYHGLGEGLDRDAQSIRLFKEMGHEMLVAYSCSKNFSLYCQRVGALFIVSENERVKSCVASQVKRIIRAIYSNPPAHGARVVAHLLKNSDLRVEWEKDLGVMRGRLVSMREELIRRLCSRSKKVNFDFLREHRGMFSYLDLEPEMAKKMMDQFAIYMIGSGRINVAGLTEKNIDRVVNSLLEVY